jgi:hypothetical protein
MNVRPYQPEDEAILREIHRRSGYEFEFPELDSFLVVLDDAGCPIMAAGEKLVPEITLICAPGGSTHPLVKLKGIALLHEALRVKLTNKGFQEAFAFLPPELERNYARHLARHFGWRKAYTAYAIKDGV